MAEKQAQLQITAELDAGHETLSKIASVKEHLVKCYRQNLYSTDTYMALIRTTQDIENMVKYHIQRTEQRYMRLVGNFNRPTSATTCFEIAQIDKKI